MHNGDKKEGNEDPFLKKIQQAMKGTEKAPLSRNERDYLWEQIEMTVQQKGKSRRPWIQIAASVLFTLGMASLLYVYVLNPQEESGFREMATQASILVPHKETRLQLGDNKILEMEGSSEIIIGDTSLNVKTGLIDQYHQSITDVAALNTLTVPYGRRSQITLVDGTKVWLNSGSTLVFPQHFSAQSREVYLYGEGYFDVKHQQDKPFYVHTSQMKVRVLGTQFNISSYADETNSQTVLVQGSVEITGYDKENKERQVQMLKPGQMADYALSSSNLVVSKVDTEAYSSWKDGYLLAKNSPLSELLKKLSRYYDTPITLEAKLPGKETFSGRLDMQENLTSVLEILSVSSSFTFKKTERGIMIQK